MNTPKYTPGPWKVTRVDYPGRRDVSFEVVAGAQDTVILQTHMRDLQSYEAELIPTDEANCNLAAAAPEMYEALTKIRDRAYDEYPDAWAAVAAWAVEALAKAAPSC